MLSVLAYPAFSVDLAARLAAFRARNEPERAAMVAPHVTLVFGVDGTYRALLQAACARLSARLAEMPVVFDAVRAEVDPFEEVAKLFLMVGGGRAALTRLHTALYAALPGVTPDPDHPYQPHMTVAAQPDLARVRALDAAQIGALPIEARIAGLELVQVTGTRLRGVQHFAFEPADD